MNFHRKLNEIRGNINMIQTDYLRVTSSKTRSLITYAFGLLKTKKSQFFSFVGKKSQRKFGPPYKGWAFSINGEKQNFFVGQRKNAHGNGTDFILDIPGKIAHLFLKNFLKHENILLGVWKIKRLDAQLTLRRQVSQDELDQQYYNFSKSFNKMQKKNDTGDRARIKGDSKTRGNYVSWDGGKSKVYEKKQKDEGYSKETRLEVQCSEGFAEAENRETFLYNALKQELDQLPRTQLLSEHRKYMRENKPSKSPSISISGASSSSDSLENGLNKNSNGKKPKRVSLSQKHLLKEVFMEVSNAHYYFAETLKKKIPTISAKQVKYLNSELSSESWRIGWRIGQNNDHEWALCPMGENPLCHLLFGKLPSKKKRQALEGRREAIFAFSKDLRRIADEFHNLPCRRQSSQKPNTNYWIKDLLEAVLENPVIGQDIDRLPRAQVKPARCFEEHSLYVQGIIRSKQQMKLAKVQLKLTEIKKSLKIKI